MDTHKSTNLLLFYPSEYLVNLVPIAGVILPEIYSDGSVTRPPDNKLDVHAASTAPLLSAGDSAARNAEYNLVQSLKEKLNARNTLLDHDTISSNIKIAGNPASSFRFKFRYSFLHQVHTPSSPNRPHALELCCSRSQKHLFLLKHFAATSCLLLSHITASFRPF